MSKRVKIFLEILKFVQNYYHFLSKICEIFGIRMSKWGDADSQMTTSFFMLQSWMLPPSLKLWRTSTRTTTRRSLDIVSIKLEYFVNNSLNSFDPSEINKNINQY